MAFSFVAAAHGDANATSITVNKPTGTVDNDIEFLFLAHLANEDPNSGLTGWTQLGTRRYDSVSGKSHSLYYRVASSEAASYTIGWATSGRSGGTIATYRDGFDTADPIDVVSDTVYTTSNATLRAAGMTVAAANSALIFFGGTHTSTSTTVTPATNPATFAEDVDNFNSSSRFTREIASVVWTGSGATGDMDATHSASTANKHAFAVALNPIAGGALTSTIALAFSESGVLTGSGALAATIAAAFSEAGVLSGTGALATTISSVFLPAGVLTGTGALSSTIPLVFSESGTLAGLSTGALTTTIAVAFSESGVLEGSGALSSALALTFADAGALTGTGALTTVIPVVFTEAGTLTNLGSGALATTISFAFSETGSLTGPGALSSAIAAAFSVSGSLIAEGSGFPIYVWERVA